MSDTIVVPHFASESEEADWWYEHREEHGVVMARAMSDGSTMTIQQLLKQRGLQGPRVAVEVDFDDMVRARKQAESRGIDSAAYVRELLHEALQQKDTAA